MIKKKKFLEKNIVADMIELLGEELDMEAEYSDLDNENKEKVQKGLPANFVSVTNFFCPKGGKSNISIFFKTAPILEYWYSLKSCW